MNKNIQRSVSLLLLLGIMGVSGFFGNNGNIITLNHPSSSVAHDPIYIVGNNAMDTFFAGNGTDGLSYETAYVLENLEIDAGGVGSAIRIENSDRFLIIRNVTLSGAELANGEAGAALYNVENLFITECNIQYNNFIGIYFFESSQNEITQNYIGNNTHGITFDDNSNYNLISENVIHSDSGNGILFENSSHNTALDNRVYGAMYGISIFNNAMYTNLTNNLLETNHIGIDIDVYSNYTTIYYNTIGDSLDGIVLNSSSHAIIDNNAISDITGYGIILNNVSDSTVMGNLIENSRIGIHAFVSSGNNIFMNKFTSCSFSCAIDDGSNNWNNTKLGNYWGDYEVRYPASSTSDGRIWNTPYQINTSSVYDYRPMVATGLPYVTTPGNRTNVEGGHCSLLYWVIYDTTILSNGHYVITKDGLLWEEGQWKDQDFIELVSDYLSPGIHIFTLYANDGTRFGEIEDIIQMTITPFGTPVLITQSQTINEYSLLVDWEITPDSDLYYLYVNDEFYNVVVAPTTEMLVEFAEEGVYNIHVVALNGVLESDPSNVITITVEEKTIPGYSFMVLISIMGILGLVLLVKRKIKTS